MGRSEHSVCRGCHTVDRLIHGENVVIKVAVEFGNGGV